MASGAWITGHISVTAKNHQEQRGCETGLSKPKTISKGLILSTKIPLPEGSTTCLSSIPTWEPISPTGTLEEHVTCKLQQGRMMKFSIPGEFCDKIKITIVAYNFFFQTREYFLSLHFLIWFNILEHLKTCLVFSRAPLLIFSHKTFAKDLCPSLWKCFLGQILASKALSKYYSWNVVYSKYFLI